MDQHEEHLYRLIFENSIQGMALRQGGKLILVNQSFADMVGYSIDELTTFEGDEALALFHPDDHATLIEHYQKVVTGKDVSGHYEYRFVRKNGEIGWWTVLISTIEYGGEVAVLCTYIDITDRKQNANKQLENETTLRAILNAVTDTIFMIDTEGTILTTNNTAAYRFGQKPDELIGTTIWNLLPAEVAELRRRKFEQVLNSGQVAHFEDQRAGIWYETTIYPIFDAAEQVARVVIFARDITERKQVEQSQLAYVLEKERSQILRNFIQQASHEFRTPLSTINTSAYMIQQTANPDLRDHHTDTIKTQTEAIATLVNALMTMVRVDNTQALDTEDIDLYALTKLLVQARHDVLSEKHLRCEIDAKVRPLVVQGNVQYIQQAIECLVDNAIKFTPDGGSIRATLTRVGDSVNPFAAIEITDTGVGINEDDLPHVFDRFFRVDKAGTTRGFGLGLAIAKAIINHHQGFIDVTSTPGEGSTFTIYLPIA
jgi:PAS domain S-box-containing protein